MKSVYTVSPIREKESCGFHPHILPQGHTDPSLSRKTFLLLSDLDSEVLQDPSHTHNHSTLPWPDLFVHPIPSWSRRLWEVIQGTPLCSTIEDTYRGLIILSIYKWRLKKEGDFFIVPMTFCDTHRDTSKPSSRWTSFTLVRRMRNTYRREPDIKFFYRV